MFLDLKEYWGLDLVAFLRGEVLSSVRLLIAQIRHLPEGSRYTARRIVEADEAGVEIEISAFDQKIQDARTWTLQHRLYAMFINAINQNTVVSGNWEKGKVPTFPVVGPIGWDPKRQKRMEVKEQVQNGDYTTADILKAMGWNG